MKAFSRETVAAWILDRQAQYAPGDGIVAALGDLVRPILNGEVEAAYQHGELDDLLPRMKKRAALAVGAGK